MQTKEPNLAAFNEWVCTCCHHVEQFCYIEGQSYWFHEDSPPPSKWFVLVVDETDTPIKKYVRWD